MARKPSKGRGRKAVAKRKPVKRKPVKPDTPPLAMTVEEWCAAYRVKKNLFYEMLRQGVGPPSILLGRRRVITIEASMEWQREREREAKEIAARTKTTEAVTEAA